MTKLAIYDKHEGEADRATNGFFRHDYLYHKNMGVRLGVGVGGVILLVIYWARIVFVDGADILTADVMQQAYESGLFLITLLMVYSLIGTIQGTWEYYLAQQRLENYLHLLRQLERIEARSRKAEAAADEDNGDDSLLYRRPRPRER